MSYKRLRGTRYGYTMGDVVQLTTNGSSFDPSTMIGNTLYAATVLNSYSQPVDGSSPLNSFAVGDPIGIVVDFLPADPASGRNELWWVFNDDSGNPYYVPHMINEISDPDVAAGTSSPNAGTSNVTTTGTATSGAPGPGSTPGAGGLGWGNINWPSILPWALGALGVIVVIAIVSKSGSKN
jgi:hypothetical protein